jgi:murein tripeptide amidase MpaA
LEITPALKKKKGFTNYEELMTFLNSLKNKFPDKIEIKFIGESQKGYEIPIVFLNSENKNNLKVWFKGGLHGNEPAGTEGLLYLLDRLLNDGSLKQLLDNTNIAILPMANIDGYIKQNRYASNGLDLNRDQTKLMALESINIKQAYTNFNPDIAVDFHEYRPYRKDFARMSDFGITSV